MPSLSGIRFMEDGGGGGGEKSRSSSAAKEEAEEDEKEKAEEEGPCQPAGRPNRELHHERAVPALCFGWIAADAIPSSISLRCVSRYGPDPGHDQRVNHFFQRNREIASIRPHA